MNIKIRLLVLFCATIWHGAAFSVNDHTIKVTAEIIEVFAGECKKMSVNEPNGNIPITDSGKRVAIFVRCYDSKTSYISNAACGMSKSDCRNKINNTITKTKADYVESIRGNIALKDNAGALIGETGVTKSEKKDVSLSKTNTAKAGALGNKLNRPSDPNKKFIDRRDSSTWYKKRIPNLCETISRQKIEAIVNDKAIYVDEGNNSFAVDSSGAMGDLTSRCMYKGEKWSTSFDVNCAYEARGVVDGLHARWNSHAGYIMQHHRGGFATISDVGDKAIWYHGDGDVNENRMIAVKGTCYFSVSLYNAVADDSVKSEFIELIKEAVEIY